MGKKKGGVRTASRAEKEARMMKPEKPYTLWTYISENIVRMILSGFILAALIMAMSQLMPSESGYTVPGVVAYIASQAYLFFKEWRKRRPKKDQKPAKK